MTRKLLNDIAAGEYDDDLEFISKAITDRRRELLPKTADFKVGDRIRFGANTRPKYMVGMGGTITGRKQTKLIVKPDAPSGRFYGDIVCPPAILIKVG